MAQASGSKRADSKSDRKSRNPRTYDRRSVQDSKDAGLQQAIVFFTEKCSDTKRFVNGRASAEEVRSAINDLKPDVMLQTTMADFWLGLTRTEGQRRRGNKPPPSPFERDDSNSNRRNFVATKRAIEEWDMQWRIREGAESLGREFAKGGTIQARNAGQMIRERLPWLVANHKIIFGLLADLPRDQLKSVVEHPETLGVSWMTVEQALRGQWKESEERREWLYRFKEAQRDIERELEAIALRQTIDERLETPRARDRKERM